MSEPAKSNPFAPPATRARATPPCPSDWSADADQTGKLFRDGTLLVAHREAILPARCVKTNAPTQARMKVSLTTANWRRRQYATLEIGLCDEIQRELQTRLSRGWMTGIIGIFLCASGPILALLAVALAIAAKDDDRLLTKFNFVELIDYVCFFSYLSLVAAGCLICVAIGIRWAALPRVTARKIDGDFIWLNGICADYLATFPPWPGVCV